MSVAELPCFTGRFTMIEVQLVGKVSQSVVVWPEEGLMSHSCKLAEPSKTWATARAGDEVLFCSPGEAVPLRLAIESITPFRV